ncbi:hypothetical protein ABMY26_35465 (plasmid) [Azospirillum sp. HJ39]|uniref:hypothetical protein n=1 Tax=Azospirillum sp. HJ39 TaxID=3159496 RepID=UPI003558A9BF
MDPRLPTLLTAPVSPRPAIEATYLDVLVRDGLPAGTGFSIALPRGWAVERTSPPVAPGPDAPIVPLARFHPGEPGAPGAGEGAGEGIGLVVWAAFLPREIHGADWLRAWMRSQDYRELDFRQAPSPTGMMGDALAVGRHDGVLRLHRLLTVKDGDLLFLIDGRMPQGGHTDHRAMQEIVLLAAMRFRLAEPTGQTFAEGFEWTELKGAETVRFLASGLWRVTPGGDAPQDGASLVLDHVGPDGAAGRGSLIAVLGAAGEATGEAAAAAAAEIERTTLAKLANQGFTLSPEAVLVAEERTAERAIAVHRRKAGRAGTPMTVLSARIVLGEGPHALPVCLILLSPDGDAGAPAFEAWAINRRAFEIALSTLR